MFKPINPRRITYRNERFTAHQISGLPENILVDKHGYLYLSYWQSLSLLDSPTKRQEKEWRVQERRFRKYNDIFALLRGFSEIVEKTQDECIPTLADLQADCADIRIQITGLRYLSPDEIRKLEQEITKAHHFLSTKVRPELQEATDQLACCILLRDSMGRINTAALSARMVAVNNRLVERLAGIFGWMNNYASWYQAVKQFATMQQRQIVDFESSLATALCHDIFSRNVERGNQRQYLATMLKKHHEWLEILSRFRGFSVWANYCLTDLSRAISFIQQGDFAAGKVIVLRLRESIKLKQLQFEINDLVLNISLKLVEKENNWQDCINRIRQIHNKLEQIQENGFKQPVRPQIQECLTVANTFLQQFRGETRSIRQAKASLKQALDLL